MDQVIILIVSVLAIVISLFAIWLAMMFYRLYSQLSLLVTEMSKGLEMSTLRLARIPVLLYDQEIISEHQKESIGLTKPEPVEEKKMEQDNNQQHLPKTDEILEI